jgi:glucose-6-phosphate 1-dehydrogenase
MTAPPDRASARTRGGAGFSIAPADRWVRTVPGAAPTRADACTLVILGALGDLTTRKLLPALLSLAEHHLLPDDFVLVGVAREQLNDDTFRKRIIEGTKQGEGASRSDATREWLAARSYFVSGDFTDPTAFDRLSQRLDEIETRNPDRPRNRLFYLAIPPSVFEAAITNLSDRGAAKRISSEDERPWTRLIIEKPFGRDLESSRTLNRLVLSRFAEHQIYRIDHYLGKESVQNLLVLRFTNVIFEPLWNRNYIHSVYISATESVGVEQRGAYYEEAGVLRDMFQNHLFQLLSLTAMEPPLSITADAIRDEKVKALRALRPLVGENAPQAVRAQYGPGIIDGTAVPAYREETGVPRTSRTPTFAAVRVFLDNWRWQGVPFYLESGKRLARRQSEIRIRFRAPPHLHGANRLIERMEPSVLAIRIQPNEGISLRFQVKVPGATHQLTPGLEITPVDMNFDYASAFSCDLPPAYETLLLDCMIGEAMLFIRSDEVETAWSMIDPLIRHWTEHPAREILTYSPGAERPQMAARLLGGANIGSDA